MRYLCITVRWLDDRYHGLLNREGPAEWPPSPFRLFQALLAGVARQGLLDAEAGKSLGWLQSLPAPLIVAPRSCAGQFIKRFVPNNDADKVPDRTAKVSRPTIFLGKPEAHFLWPLEGTEPETTGVIEATQFLTCLGWGIDMAYGDAGIVDSKQINALPGIRWIPKPGVSREKGLLRVPMEGSLMDLSNAHKSALNRIEHGQPLRTVDKPKVFDRVFYASTEQPLGSPYALFSLRTISDDAYRHPHAKLMHVAGMARCAAIKAMKEYPPEGIANPEEWVKSFVRGRRPEGGTDHKQFSYVPLPSIVAPFECEAELDHLAGQLDGIQLQTEGGGEGPFLDRLRSPDSVARQYLESSREWASVTPVILPGHDDHKPAKTIKLIDRALAQSGIEQSCKFTWGAMPHFNNCLTAHKPDPSGRRIAYFRPNHLEGLTAVHVRLTFEQAVTGPLIVGAGRHCGFGLLAPV